MTTSIFVKENTEDFKRNTENKDNKCTDFVCNLGESDGCASSKMFMFIKTKVAYHIPISTTYI